MGGCLSREKNDQAQMMAQMSRPTAQHRGSITYLKPRDNCENEEALQRFRSIEVTEALELGGLKIRYGYMSQRGYYPDGEFVRLKIEFGVTWHDISCRLLPPPDNVCVFVFVIVIVIIIIIVPSSLHD